MNKRRIPIARYSTLLLAAFLCSCAGADEGENRIHPETWPLQAPVLERDPAMEQRIAGLLERMTMEEKVGQVIQADIGSVTPDDVRKYNLGSILNGGGSAPDGNLRNTPDSWLELADAFWSASTDRSDGGLGIPLIWGTDAVHGHSNIVGATLFPHNIGLGAANDPDLMYEIGRITALEIAATGLDWTFAPTLAVARNDRWGRTYESYSEDPRIVAAYAGPFVKGLQGAPGTEDFLAAGRVIATAKHFVGDGGTFNGIDRGDNRSSEDGLRDIHAAGYPPAIAAGAQTVMASYNSFHGKHMHGYREMLTDVLVGRMGFDGFVISDWNGHADVAGCAADSCPTAFNAGLDVFMAPNEWKRLHHNLLDQVRSGVISEARLDQAVGRVLRVKLRAGIIDRPKPSERPYAGDWDLLAAPAHRAVAREAVRKSLVLLKNENGLLPIPAAGNVLVAGDGAHDIGKQSGGWTLSWQGTDNRNEHFPHGTSIYEGIAEAVQAGGGNAVLSEDGRWETKPDAAIVVFGEEPYAEMQGDRQNVDYAADDGLELLQSFRAAGIPTVSIFLSGRPLWVNPELNRSDAFVAAWLPGSEGGGIADLIIGDAEGAARNDFSGRLSFSWPARADQVEVNVGDADYDPLFAYGYGLSYVSPGTVPMLPEESGVDTTAGAGQLIEYGDPVGSWRLMLRDASGDALITDVRGASLTRSLTIAPVDFELQEDTFVLEWSGEGSMVLVGPASDFSDEATANAALELRFQVIESAADNASLAVGGGALATGEAFRSLAGKGWHTVRLALTCFADAGADLSAVAEPLLISADGPMKLQLASARLVTGQAAADCSIP